MAKAGETVHLLFEFQDSDGYGYYFDDLAAFNAADYDIYYELAGTETALTYAVAPIPEADEWAASTAYSLGDRVIPTTGEPYMLECTTAGTSDSTEPSWDSTIGNTTSDNTATWTTRAIRGLHDITYEAESGQSLIVVRRPHDVTANPEAYYGDTETSDLDSLRAAINSSVSTPGVLTAQDVDLGSITSGDAYRSVVLEVPSDIASQIWGVTDLTGYLITAAGKFDPDDASSVSITAAWETDGSDREFRISWTTMPAAITSEIGDNRTLDFYIDVQVTKADSSEPFTTNKYTMQIVWDRN